MELHTACGDVIQCPATYCVDSLLFPQQFVTLILTICCLSDRHGDRKRQNIAEEIFYGSIIRERERGLILVSKLNKAER